MIEKLYQLALNWKSDGLCKQKETPDGLKTDLDKLSDDIREHLNAFGGKSPDSSKPLFVSQLAATYAKEKSEVKSHEQKQRQRQAKREKSHQQISGQDLLIKTKIVLCENN